MAQIKNFPRKLTESRNRLELRHHVTSTLDGQEVEGVHVLGDHTADLLVVVVEPLAPSILLGQSHQIGGPVLTASVRHGSIGVAAEDENTHVVLHELLVVRNQRVLQYVAVVVGVDGLAANAPFNLLITYVECALNFGFLNKNRH